MKYIVGILIVGLLGTNYVQYRNKRKLEDLSQLQAVELSQLQDSLLTYKTKAGQLVSKVQAVEVDKRNLRESLEASGTTIKELRNKDIRWRRLVSSLRLELQSVGEGQTEVTDTFYVVENTTDTVYYQSVSDWSNGYLSIFDAKIEKKQLDFNYNYQTDVEIFQEKRRKETIITVSLSDPNASAITGSSIVVPHKNKWYEKWWLQMGIGAVGGYLIAK